MRVGATWGINSSARILIFIPSTADFIVLFDHEVWDAGMLQLNGGVETSHAGANDGYDKFPQILRWWRIHPNQSPRPRVQGQLLQPHFQLGRGNVGSSGKAEAAAETLRGTAKNVGGTLVPIRLEKGRCLGLNHRQ